MSSGIYTRLFCFLSNWNSSVFLRQLSKVTPTKPLRLAPSQQELLLQLFEPRTKCALQQGRVRVLALGACVSQL